MEKFTAFLLLLNAIHLTVRTEKASLQSIDHKLRAIVNRLYRHEIRSRAVDEVTTNALRTIASLLADQNSRMFSLERTINHIQVTSSNLEAANIAQNKKLDEQSEVFAWIQRNFLQNNSQPRPTDANRRGTLLCGVSSSSANSNLTHILDLILQPMAQEQSTYLQDLMNETLKMSDRVSRLEDQTLSLISRSENTSQSLFRLDHLYKHHQELHSAFNNDVNNSTTALEKRLTGLQDMLSELLNDFRQVSERSARQFMAESDEVTVESDQSAVESIRNDISSLYHNISEEMGSFRQEMKDIYPAEVAKTNKSIVQMERQLQYGLAQILANIEEKSSETQASISSSMFSGCAQLFDQQASSQAQVWRNVSALMGEEMTRIWRQLGAISSMFRQSVEVLERIDAKTSQYINGSINSAEKVRGTVRHVAEKVDDVEDDLNYLLGRLSLVVSEFGHIRSSLIDQLADMRKSFRSFGSDLSTIEDREKVT